MLNVHNTSALKRNFSLRVLSGLALLFSLAINAEAAVVDQSGIISTNTTWLASDVHNVTGTVTVSSGVQLTIEAGAVVKFAANTQLTVSGTLSAVGTDTNRIIFTSVKDDTAGGDTNGDGVATTPTAGDWRYLYFAGAGSSASRVEYAEVRYAGQTTAAVYTYASSMTLANSIISNSLTHGFNAINSGSPTLTGNTITESGQSGIYISAGTPTINGNTLSNNTDWGLYYGSNSLVPVPTNNTITGNDSAVQISFASIFGVTDGNVISGNTNNSIKIIANGTLSRNVTLGSGAVYYFLGSGTVASTYTLTLQPGVIFKFATATTGLTINGILNAVGTTGNRIIFTSGKDDHISAGGDTNGDGVATTPTAGDWRYLYFAGAGSSASRVEYAEVRYAGQTTAAVYTYASSMTLANSIISNSLTHGFNAINSGSPTLTGNTITESGQSGIYISAGTPTINGNTLSNNTDWGLYYGSNSLVPVPTNNTITGNDSAVQISFASIFGVTDGNVISGNTNNSIKIIANGTLSRNVTLGSGAVYYFLGSGTVASTYTLTLQPGVIFKFATATTGLTINGILNAVGTTGNRIIFTSGKDDHISAGGDTNGDGVATTPTAGDWRYLYFAGAGSSASRVEYAEVRYAGQTTAAVYTSASSMTLANSIISNSLTHGFNAINSGSPTLTGNTITESGQSGIYISAGTPAISSNTITGSGQSGVYIWGGTPTINGNIISNNTDWGLYYAYGTVVPVPTNNTIIGNLRGARIPLASMPNPIDNNTLVPNQINGLWIIGGTRATSLQLPQQTDGTSVFNTYHISANSTISNGATLIVDPGVIMKFAYNTGLTVNGVLTAAGNASAPVVFTSVKDDSYGGDLNQDGSATTPRNADWRGITVSASAPVNQSLISYAHVHYGGTANAALDINAVMTVENSIISNSPSSGIYLYNISSTITGNHIWGNGLHGIYARYGGSTPTISNNHISSNASNGIYLSNGAVALVNNNQFYSNRNLGLSNQGPGTVNATLNWWGDSDGSGPYHGTTNPTGTGNGVSDFVDYSSYQLDIGTPFSYINHSLSAGSTYGAMTPPTLIQGTLSDEWDATLLSPDRTMAWDNNEVVMAYANLDPVKRYKVRVSYFNKETGLDSVQTMTDGAGRPIHGTFLIPWSGNPVQYEFPIPQSYYTDGNLSLKFRRDNTSSTSRAAIPEVWLIQTDQAAGAPRFEVIEFNDIDGSGGLSLGDEYYFRFSEVMDSSLILNNTTDANARLSPEGGLIYGSTNTVRWIDGDTTAVVTVTNGFTITGTELVSAIGLKDTLGNLVLGNQRLNLNDTVAPQFTALTWVDADASGALSLGDQYTFRFSESMDITDVVDGTTDANTGLSPAGSRIYGTLNTVSWSPDKREVTVTVTDGYTIIGDENVTPTISDAAGNGAQGTQLLVGRELTAPLITEIVYDDIDGSGTLSEGDRYIFRFDEPMSEAALLDNTTDANINLPALDAPSTIQIYGTTNRINWNASGTEVSVYLTAGFTVSGDETVDPSDTVTDISNNPVANTGVLTSTDTVAPEIIDASGSGSSPVPPTTTYQITVQFNGSVDVAVEPSIDVTGSVLSPVVSSGGTWSTTVYTNDTYTTPGIILTRDMVGALEVNVSGAQDLVIPTPNVMTPVTSVYEFYVQASAPTISNHAISPTVNNVTTSSITLEGTSTADTEIFINSDAAPVAVADALGNWSAVRSLPQGANDLVVYARDSVGNASESVTVKFFVDSVAPVVTGITPANGTVTNAAPTSVTVTYNETGSGISIENSSLAVSRDGLAFNGSWVDGSGVLTFTPGIAIYEGEYLVNATLVDGLGLVSSAASSSFTLDQTAPATPVLDAFPDITNNATQTFSGDKEADTAIWLNGVEVVALNAATTWSYDATLAVGANSLSFAARDAAGNESDPAIANISYDDIAPNPVIIGATNEGSGTQATLDWNDYDEAANGGDIQHYLVYQSGASFSDVSALTAIDTVPGGVKTYTVSGLNRGSTYYFAVVAVDSSNNALTNVTADSVVMADSLPPEEVTALSAESFATSLTINWIASANSDADLAGYNLYFNGSATPTVLAPADTSYNITGLTPATGYPVKLTSFDNDGNESPGAEITGTTLLPHPAGLVITPYSGRVNISWTQAQPSNLVKSYAIYASDTIFTSVDGMTPKLVVGANITNGGVAGLVNGTPYYFTVTTINLSDGEDKAVTTVSETPAADISGPTITEVKYDGVALISGATLTTSGEISLLASDPSGVAQVQFALDAINFGTDTNGSDGYDASLDILAKTDGVHTLTITAQDSLNNSSSLDIPVTIALAPPLAPSISSPIDGTVYNDPGITVQGVAEPGTEVQLYNNTVAEGALVAADSSGNYTAGVNLIEGANSITAAAQNRGGLGQQSPPVTITLDSSVPATPTGLTAQPRAGGEIRLVWNASSDTRTVGFNVYRSSIPFSNIASATKANTNLITEASYVDLTPVDGQYYYSVIAVNALGTPSELSNQVSIEADSQPPKALSIEYSPSGNYDSVSGRMAAGSVAVILTVDETLLTTPFLSIAPSNGVPITVNLTRSTDTVYTGSFDISTVTPGGTAYAVFSARDVVGNRGTDIFEGSTIEIDTQGPVVTSLILSPLEPVKNDSLAPVTINFEMLLSEAAVDAGGPSFEYLLSGAGRIALPVDSIIQTDATRWNGSVVLPADAGLTAVENLSFIFSATDDLGNVSSKIEGDNLFQVYQGDLPPLATPTGLTGTALPAGEIRLNWDVVEGAAEYQLYRQALGETELSAYQRVSATEYTDTTLSDGAYTYSVASVRQENTQEGISAQGTSVTVNADTVASDAPQSLTLELVGAGISASWVAPVTTDTLTYNLYRLSTEIFAVNALTPVITGITELTTIDSIPSNTDHYYAVTAVDEAGNESLPSNSPYLNFDLLPVASLSVIQVDQAAPILGWTHNGATITGYKVYEGLNLDEPLYSGAESSYTDTGYNSDTRVYTVTATDGTASSIGRVITLPQISASLNADSVIKRGIMNRMMYTVTNNSPVAVSNVRIKAGVQTYESMSDEFSLAAGETRQVEVIFGGYSDLTDTATLATTIDITPNPGEKIEIVRNSDILIADAGLALGLTTQDFVRSGTGRVQFSLDNTSDVEIEIVTATQTGNAVSNEIRFKLVDVDGNVLNTQSIQQFTGNGVVTLANGQTVARIPANTAFTSQWVDIAVPTNAPEQLYIVLEVDQIHYHLGGADEVNIAGLTSRRQVTLVETSYYASVDSATPASSFGDQDIIINGYAINRTTTLNEATVPVKLVVAANGFERSFDLITDSSGQYSYTFKPLPGESGNYKVSAIHPDIVDRPEQGQFNISRVLVSPAQANFHVPRNYEATGDFAITAGDGSSATNLRLEYLATDQAGGVLPTGIQVALPAAINLSANQSSNVNVLFSGDDTADETGSFVLVLRSDEGGVKSLAQITVDYQLSTAEPFLASTPNFIETGMLHGDNITEIVTLENKGFANLENVQLALLTTAGTEAPGWVSLASPTNQGTIAVGEKRPVQVVFSPDATITEGIKEYKLRVTSDNYTTTDIRVYATVTTSAVGSILFRTSDIYTATFDAEGNIIQGLEGASIKLINELTSEIIPAITTDSLGEALFTDIPAGSYIYRASAANHEDKSGSVKVKPALLVSEDVFIDYNLVTVEWIINEITISDTYEVTLSATFETDVPAAVVVAEPASVELPDMQVGDVYYGEYRLTNYGLIRADNLDVYLPPDDQFFKYELMDGLPKSLEAQESITVAYRVIMLQSLDADGTGTGGGCSNYASCGGAGFDYTCPNDATTSGSASHCNTKSKSSSCGSTSGDTGGVGGEFFEGGGNYLGGFTEGVSGGDLGISACRVGSDGGAGGGGPTPVVSSSTGSGSGGPPNCPSGNDGGGNS